eukprot:366433-Chlamydomonas_euryale.AAC.8
MTTRLRAARAAERQGHHELKALIVHAPCAGLARPAVPIQPKGFKVSKLKPPATIFEVDIRHTYPCFPSPRMDGMHLFVIEGAHCPVTPCGVVGRHAYSTGSDSCILAVWTPVDLAVWTPVAAGPSADTTAKGA